MTPTIPIRAMADAGLRTGDRVRAEAKGRGRVLLVREDDLIERYAGALTGVYRRGELRELRVDVGLTPHRGRSHPDHGSALAKASGQGRRRTLISSVVQGCVAAWAGTSSADISITS